MSVKASWILGCYNKQSWIAEALYTILNQSEKNIEVCIVDDASDDYSMDVINHYAAKDNRIKVAKNDKNMGASYTMNKATEMATAPVIIVAAADDTYSPRRTEWTLQYFKKHPEIDVVYFPFLKCFFDLIPFEFKLAPKFDGELLQKPNGQFIGHGFSAYRKTVADKVKYRTELKHGIDHVFFLDVFKAGFKFGNVEGDKKIAGHYRFTPKMMSLEHRAEIVAQDGELIK